MHNAVLILTKKIKALEAKINVAKESKIARTLLSIPGFGTICTSELAGEIGTVERFSKEGSLALYLGMATLDKSSKYQGSKQPKQINTRAKAAVMVALDRHRKHVPQSQRYYEKNGARGKSTIRRFELWDATCSRIIYRRPRVPDVPEKGNTNSKVSPRSLIKTQIRKPKISAQINRIYQ